MGCGESKHAVATENVTIPKNKRSLSSKSDSTKGENGVAETTSDEKVEVIAPKVAALEKEEAKENVSEKKETEEKVVETKNATTPVAVEEIKAEETIKPIEEKEEVSPASEATDAAKPEPAKDVDNPETEEKPKEENATATTDLKTD